MMKAQPENKTASGNAPKVTAVKLDWIPDSDPDLSWLDQSDEDMGEGFEVRSQERKATYGQRWEMLGCVAKAEVQYPIGNGSFRIETLTSGGLWGIESDFDADYKRTIEDEQLADLADHLLHFGIEITSEQLRAIV